MPWAPELFSAPALEQLIDQRRRDEVLAVPYFFGLLSEEPDALVESFAREPLVHDPVRGRVKGAKAFEAFVRNTKAGLQQRAARVEDVERIILARHGFEEVVLHLDGDDGRVELPVAIVAEHPSSDGRIDELRVYFSNRPLIGQHAGRPPLLQPDPDLRLAPIVADYERALADGDVDALVAGFEADGYLREAGGSQQVRRGADELRAFFEQLFSNAGGLSIEPCAFIDDERSCALEYNLVRWGKTAMPPQAGLAVFVRGASGKLAAVRIYDDVALPAR